MKTKHTKGEWNLETNVNHYPMIMNDEGNVIASLFDTKDGSIFYGIALNEVEANARLIKAAPKMLEFLMKQYKGWDNLSSQRKLSSAEEDQYREITYLIHLAIKE